MPDMPGSMMSSKIRSCSPERARLQARSAVEGLFYLVALISELQLHHPGQLFLVLDEQDFFRQGTASFQKHRHRLRPRPRS